MLSESTWTATCNNGVVRKRKPSSLSPDPFGWFRAKHTLNFEAQFLLHPCHRSSNRKRPSTQEESGTVRTAATRKSPSRKPRSLRHPRPTSRRKSFPMAQESLSLVLALCSAEERTNFRRFIREFKTKEMHMSHINRREAILGI